MICWELEMKGTTPDVKNEVQPGAPRVAGETKMQNQPLKIIAQNVNFFYGKTWLT